MPMFIGLALKGLKLLKKKKLLNKLRKAAITRFKQNTTFPGAFSKFKRRQTDLNIPGLPPKLKIPTGLRPGSGARKAQRAYGTRRDV